MINDYISSNIIISRIEDEYSIQSADYINKIPNWTLNVLRDINVKQFYQNVNPTLEFNNYKCKLPDNINKVYQVYINNYKATLDIKNTLILKGSQNTFVSDFNGEVYPALIVPEIPIVEEENTVISTEEEILATLERYKSVQYNEDIIYRISNGWIHTNIEQGECTIVGGAYPYLFDENLELLFPLIPNDENLINAIVQYSLKTILMRGYKHPILSLEKNNEFVNPSISYKIYKSKARNSCNALSSDAKESLTKLLLTNII